MVLLEGVPKTQTRLYVWIECKIKLSKPFNQPATKTNWLTIRLSASRQSGDLQLVFCKQYHIIFLGVSAIKNIFFAIL